MSYGEPTMFDSVFKFFRKPTADEMAQNELEDSRRSLLECQRMKDYYDNMVNFHAKRISALNKGRKSIEDALGVHP
jgi:hypothetical protein